MFKGQDALQKTYMCVLVEVYFTTPLKYHLKTNMEVLFIFSSKATLEDTMMAKK